MADSLREYLVSIGFQVDEASFRKFTGAVTGSAAPVLKLGAAVAATATAVEVMVERVSRQMSDLFYAGQRANVLAGSLQAVSFAATQIGLSASTGANLLGGLARAMREQPGTRSIIEQFAGPGGLKEFNGQLGVTQGGLFSILDRLKEMSDHGQFYMANSLAGVMGLPTGDDLSQLLRNLDQFKASTKETADSLNTFGINADEAAKKGKELGQHFNSLEQDARNLGVRIATDLTPAVEHMVDWLDRGLRKFGEFNNAHGGVPGMIAAGGAETAGGIGILSLLSKVPGFRWLGGPVLGALGPLGAFLYTMRPSAANEGEDEYIKSHPETFTPSDTFKSTVDHFVRAGWTPGQATGIAVNLAKESGINPGATGDSGAAYGVGQWHRDRQEAFRKWAGRDIRGSSLDQQLDFVQFELTHDERNAGNRLRNALTAKSAAETVSRYYERPAGGESEAIERGRAAASVTLNQKTEINVNGTGDAAGTARRVLEGQDRTNADAVRNLGSVVR